MGILVEINMPVEFSKGRSNFSISASNLLIGSEIQHHLAGVLPKFPPREFRKLAEHCWEIQFQLVCSVAPMLLLTELPVYKNLLLG